MNNGIITDYKILTHRGDPSLTRDPSERLSSDVNDHLKLGYSLCGELKITSCANKYGSNLVMSQVVCKK